MRTGIQVIERFKTLFSGSQVAYGRWDPSMDPPGLTKHGAPTTVEYHLHLEGQVGLGLVPVNSEGICYFGAIDIDVDTIDHNRLLADVTKLNLPLNVCRSKSGGAHCYVFIQQGISAKLLQQALGLWAGFLGYPRAEIFPKQDRSTLSNIGNWINLPYFAGDATTRYRVGPEGAQTLQEFLDTCIYFDPNKKVEVSVSTNGEKPQMPPCLESMQKEGIGAGYRNQALLNYAIFYRKSSPEGWATLSREQNSQYFSPPLDTREVDGVLQSANRNKYQYTCDSEPLRGYCNRPVCSTLEYGVGHMPWQESGAHDDLDVRNCRKLLTKPPKYILEVNGKDITLDWEAFYSFTSFKSKIGEGLNIIVANRKQASWETTVRDLLSKRTDVEAPDDASIIGLVVEKLYEFLVLRERATDREDLLRGLPIEDGNFVLFKMSDLRRYLQGFKLDRIEGSELFLVLQQFGLESRRIRVNGRVVAAWAYPLSRLREHEQTEDFKVQDFATKLKPEV